MGVIVAVFRGMGTVPDERERSMVSEKVGMGSRERVVCFMLQMVVVREEGETGLKIAYDYNCHVDLIKLLQQEGDLVKLRCARQKMSDLFPLTEELWLDWLKDEIRMAIEKPDMEKAYQLFKKSVKDYICPEIWLEYAQYSIGGIGEQGGIDQARGIFEQALTAVGLHMTRGTAIWEAFREFENAILGTLQLVAEPPKLAEYQFYIDFEMKTGDPARIQIIFERALAENCLVPDLWTRFTLYLDKQLKIKDLVLSAYERAVRNCPWTLGLWKNYLLALERHGAAHKTVIDTFEKALNAGFIQALDYVELWQAYLDYLRRRVNFSQDSSEELEELRSAFTRGLDYLKQDVEQRFSESGDPSCTILQNWARIEKRGNCKNYKISNQKARELWDSIMTKGNAKYANMWLEYYNLERAYGDPQHCRKALLRAVQCTTDYPEHVCDVLLNFERMEGSLEDWDLAAEKTEAKLNRVNEQRAKAAAKEALIAQQEEERNVDRRKSRAEKKAAKKPSKKTRANDTEEVEEDMETESGIHGHRTIKKILETPASQKQKAVAASRNVQKVLHDKSKDKYTVFVSNLSYSIHNPEDRLKEVFASIGQIAEVRPVYSNKGHFRGYCYVEFSEEKEVADALRLDRELVEGRPMFVSPCVDKTKNPEFKVFKYSTSLEKHKLFVSGLPFSCTKEELEELCKEHGILKQIRLVTNRAGKPKGLAYIEYENEAQASQAVLKMDGMMIKDHVISVAISNPPQRKPGDSMETSSLVTRQMYGARGKSRTQLALLPRALRQQPAPETTTANGTCKNQHGDSTEGEAKRMTNADFAKMLMK
uniref:Spliceosome associated factor 3, U4/U6 recycling protein n=1 Tax=Callorhinchus milii TaxID=7868 RepID=A0A4W3ILN4_CALMI